MIRQVELDRNSVRVDGQDITDWCTGYQLIVSHNDVPRLYIETVADLVQYRGPAVVSPTPLDGIRRLRERLAKGTDHGT